VSDLTELRRASGAFLTRLLIAYGTDPPDVLRRMADDLEGLETG